MSTYLFGLWHAQYARMLIVRISDLGTLIEGTVLLHHLCLYQGVELK